MRLAAILLTHERPDALALALAGMARQSLLPAEVIVTEDGESAATRACVERAAAGFPVRLVHLTQPHRGPRMSAARNRAVAAARGDYVLFLDGDQLPHRHLVADHAAVARAGCFVQGSRALAGPRLTARLLAGGTLPGPLAPDLRRRRNLLRLAPLRRLLARRRRSPRGIKSCNLAFWRDDLLRLNGFDEEMAGWGLEDGELCARATHLGLWRRDLRLGGGVVHLWHGPPAVLAGDNPNWRIYRETLRAARTRCDRGIDGHRGLLLAAPPDLREGAGARGAADQAAPETAAGAPAPP